MGDARKTMIKALKAGDGAAVELVLRLRAAPEIAITPATLSRCIRLGSERSSRRKRIAKHGERWADDAAWSAAHDAALAEALAIAGQRRRR